MSIAEYIYTVLLKPKPLKALANAVLLRMVPERLRVGPADLYLNRDDPVISGALTFGVYERSEQEFLAKHLYGDMVMVDIGANIGLYTVLAIHYLNAHGRIVAVEPHRKSFAMLQKNIAANQAKNTDCPKTDALNIAATSDFGQKQLRLNPENRGDNRLYHGTYLGQLENWDTQSVEGRPLDEVLAELGVTEVNFVKIDIQGYEEKALTGFKKTLARSDKVILVSEFWPMGLKEAGGDPHEYLQMLIDLGFSLFTLNEKPRGTVKSLDDPAGLIARLQGRKYIDIVAAKGYALQG